MSGRVSKKLVPSLADIDGAILMVNAIDPQMATVGVFLDAIEDLPHFIVLNKVDAVSATKVQQIANTLQNMGKTVVWTSVKEKRGFTSLVGNLHKLPEGKIAVLGIFNSGKTSLINALTGDNAEVGDIPGTTLELTSHKYFNWILVDTVGQVIDVNKPLMVSVDLDGCDTTRARILECLMADKTGLENSIMSAIESIEQAVQLIKERVAAGNKIITLGAGASALVAMEMAGQGQETGLPIMVFTNNFETAQPLSFAKGAGEDELGMSEYVALAIQAGDVVIGISASGGTAFVHETLFLAKGKGAFTISITENADTPLGKASDIIIKSEAKPEGPSSSRIQTAHLAIGHALMLTIADERGVTAQRSIEYMLAHSVPNKKMGIK